MGLEDMSFGNIGGSTPTSAAKKKEYDDAWANAFKNATITLPKTESQKATDIGTQYKTAVQAAQVQPETVSKQWEDYTTKQTGTAGTYAAQMEKILAENAKKQTELEAKYNERINPQYDVISNAQKSVQSAMEAAQAKYNAEQQSATDFFNTDIKGRYTSEMDKAAKEYESIKNQVQAKMDATDSYYQNSLKPQYARLMEGGLSLKDASDPSNYVSQGVQNAYEGLIQKSQKEADTLGRNIKRGGQADYGVLAALGNQARGSVAAPMTGAQMQLAQQASSNQASAAYQQAMQRIAGIEDQQRLYAQQTRQTGLESGMDQSWRNFDNYQTGIKTAQEGDIANMNAQLSGTSQLGNIANMAANTQFQGINSLQGARSNLSSNIAQLIGGAQQAATSGGQALGGLASQYTNLAGNQYQNQAALANQLSEQAQVLPTFGYQTQSGFNQGGYGVANQMTQLGSKNATDIANIDYASQMENLLSDKNERIRQENMKMQKEAIAAGIAAQQAQADAQQEGNFMGSLFGTLGTVGGGALAGIATGGNPVAIMGGASLGGGLASRASGMFGGTGLTNQAQPINYAQYANAFSPQVAKTQVGVSPTMQNSVFTPSGLAAAQQQYGLGIDPSLYSSPYSRYGIQASNPYYNY